MSDIYNATSQCNNDFIHLFVFQIAINTTLPCNECSSEAENWMCLSCHKVLCGRYVMEHMMFHNIETSHPMALSFSDLSVWCYPCESYIDNKKLHVYKNLAHLHKFGEEMQWAYDDLQSHNNDSDDDDDDDSSSCGTGFSRSQQNNFYIQLNMDSSNN